MTNNMDEFEQDQFDPLDEQEKTQRTPKQTLLEAWRNKPLFKLLVIMGFVVFALAGALGAFSGSPEIETAKIAKAPNLQEAPGGQSSPFFIEQNTQANEQRVKQAMEQGGSAMPTPHGTNIDLSDLTDKDRKDPLLEFRAETERLRQEVRAEQKQAAQQMQILQQQAAQRPQEEDDSLSRAMQRQMQELMKSWEPRGMTSVNGVAVPKEELASSVVQVPSTAEGGVAGGPAATARKRSKPLVPAGTVNYAQLLTEANSDVPGPILLQILSGPLSGGRAIGQFQVMNDYLVLTFNRVSFKGKDFSINAIALDPNTTLGGLATEVDHRYFSRLLLPAAASFISAFGSALGSGSSEAVTSGDSVIVTQAQKGYKDATYAGLGQVGETLSEFFQNEANQTRPLVRVAVGTPMGLFFLQPVTDPSEEPEQMFAVGQPGFQELLAQGYQRGVAATASGVSYPGVSGGYGASSGVSYPSAASGYGMNPYRSMTGAGAYNPATNAGFVSGNQPLNMGNTTIYGR